jgi:hypothetical protein
MYVCILFFPRKEKFSWPSVHMQDAHGQGQACRMYYYSIISVIVANKIFRLSKRKIVL